MPAAKKTKAVAIPAVDNSERVSREKQAGVMRRGQQAKYKADPATVREWGKLVERPTPEAKTLFLEFLSRCPVVTAAARYAGISRRTAYDWAAADPEFASNWQHAREEGKDILEMALFESALNGNTLAQIFLAKAWRYGGTDGSTMHIGSEDKKEAKKWQVEFIDAEYKAE